jgi:hypothetical protein
LSRLVVVKPVILGAACGGSMSRVEASMRRKPYIGALAAFFTLPAAVGWADSWCIRDKAGMIAPICAFSSSADCIHAALVGPSGSVCVPEGTPAARYKDQADKAPKRPYRQDADRDYS